MLSARSSMILAGIGLVIGGLVYDVIFAGIPYPDPTPEMSEAYDRHAWIASLHRWAGVSLLVAGFVSTFFSRFGADAPQRPASRWVWLWAALAVYVTSLLSSGAVMLSADICPGPAAMTPPVMALALPALPAAGFVVGFTILLSLVSSSPVAAIIGLVLLVALVALLALTGWLGLRAAREGRWLNGATAIFLLTLAGLSALSTLSFCGSLTA